LREYVRQRLPEYMVPTAYVELSKLPLTRHGKVDWAALPKPETSNAHPGSDFVAPENEIEEVVASIWRKVLRVEKVSCDKNFFDLGGHSLLIVQVANHLRNTFERDISITELFQYPTIRSLASHLSQKRVEAVSFERVYERTSRREIAFRRQKQFTHERERKHNERS
jgi:acyl carrier protein